MYSLDLIKALIKESSQSIRENEKMNQGEAVRLVCEKHNAHELHGLILAIVLHDLGWMVCEDENPEDYS